MRSVDPGLDTMSSVKRGRYISCVPLLFFCCLNPACLGQTVTIRVVNVTNGSPVGNERVYISGISGKAAGEEEELLKLKTKPIRADQTLTTNGKGEVEFILPQPAPGYFYVRTAVNESHWDCSCLVRISTDELVQKGFVRLSPNAARASTTPQIHPKPGEVVFALRPLSLWIRFFFPLLKG